MMSKRVLAGILALSGATAASAAEAITYGYDALGRLVTVAHSGSVNNGRQTGYAYDAADNRTSATTG